MAFRWERPAALRRGVFPGGPHEKYSSGIFRVCFLIKNTCSEFSGPLCHADGLTVSGRDFTGPCRPQRGSKVCAALRVCRDSPRPITIRRDLLRSITPPPPPNKNGTAACVAASGCLSSGTTSSNTGCSHFPAFFN